MAPPRKGLSLFQKLADQVHTCIQGRQLLKFVVVAGKAMRAATNGLKTLEINYVHRWSGGVYNPHQLRDDMRAHFNRVSDRVVRDKMIAQFQKQNPLPAKTSHEKVVAARAESAWPGPDRAIARRKLKNPRAWPRKFQHSKLIPRIQSWGEWVLDNYQYLMTHRTPGELGLRFHPPKGDSPNGDIQAISDFTVQLNNAYLRLLKTCEKGPYGVWAPIPSAAHRCRVPKGCLEGLRKWEKLFTQTKGKVAVRMRRRIQAKIQEIERVRRSALCRKVRRSA
jgi:hypothetical protein